MGQRGERIITIGPISLPWGRKTKRREYVEQVQVSRIQSRVGRRTNGELLERIIVRVLPLVMVIEK